MVRKTKKIKRKRQTLRSRKYRGGNKVKYTDLVEYVIKQTQLLPKKWKKDINQKYGEFDFRQFKKTCINIDNTECKNLLYYLILRLKEYDGDINNIKRSSFKKNILNTEYEKIIYHPDKLDEALSNNNNYDYAQGSNDPQIVLSDNEPPIVLSDNGPNDPEELYQTLKSEGGKKKTRRRGQRPPHPQ